VEYQGFTLWLVAPDTWRIEFPGGHKTPPMKLGDEAAARAEVDNIIKHLADPQASM
jgi:hypothetical protein